MKPITLGLATGLFVLACFAPVVPGTSLTYGNPSRVYSLTDAFFISDFGQRIGNTMLTTAANAAETVTDMSSADDPAIDMSKLVRIGDQDFNITADPSVSMEAISSASVRKVGFGHESQVSVVTTSTGVYSTDGLASAHVLYPGITATPANSANTLAERIGRVFMLGGGTWVSADLAGAGSFVTFGPMKGGGGYVTGSNGTCIRGKNFAGCY